MSSQLPLSRIVSPITVTISIVSAASASAADLSKSSPGSRPDALQPTQPPVSRVGREPEGGYM